MPAFGKREFGAGPVVHRSFWAAAVLGALFFGSSANGAEGFRIAGIVPRLASGLVLSGTVELNLPSKVEEALNNGIPLELVIDIRLYQRRALLWDRKVQAWTVRRELRYHALSGQYLVSGEPPVPQNRESFNSIAEALAQAGSLDDLNMPLSQPVLPEADYRVAVRAQLDIEALPHLLRPVAYTSRAWDLDTGWTTWQVQR